MEVISENNKQNQLRREKGDDTRTQSGRLVWSPSQTNESSLLLGKLPLNTLSKTFGYSHSTTYSQFPISQVRLYILI